LSAPLVPFTAYGWTPGYLRARSLSNNFTCSQVPLMGFSPSSEVAQAPSRCVESLVSPKARSASLEVLSPSASPRSRHRHKLARSANPTALHLQVFSTSWRLLPPRACRPCFMPDPLLGSTLQSFIPPAQPYVVPNAVPLLAFDPPSGYFSTRESATRISGLD